MTPPASLRLAVAQTAPVLGDRDGNLSRLLSWAARAADAGAHLVLFTECALSGYALQSRAEAASLAETVPGPPTDALSALCRDRGLFVALGLIERAGDRLHNAAVVVGPEGVAAVHRKQHLPGIGADRFLDPGDPPIAVHRLDALDLNLGLLVCYDAVFPEPPRVQALLGADLVAIPTNWATGTEPIADHLTPTRAVENVVYCAAANRVGEERGFRYVGRSAIADPFGRVLARASADAEELILAEVVPARARAKRIVRVPGEAEIDRFADRRPALYGRIAEP
jgi:predicted amidohydrolase